ncbi:MAG: hypothetical protein H6Q31_1604 [Bacteroidetes bacterium]|nr:hypothetical protein [Bacteroidota bacterium]
MCTRQSSSAKATMPQGGDAWRGTTVLAGTITAGTQVVLLREVLSAFLGNELIIGVLFFDWLALTGIGALLARRWSSRLPLFAIVPCVLAALCVFPPLTFAGFRFLPLLVAPPGSMLDIWLFLAGALLALAPLCLVSGAIFTLLIRVSTTSGTSNPVGSVYAWEAMGSLAGGALFGFLLFDIIPSQDLLLILCAGAGLSGAVLFSCRRMRSVAVALLPVVLMLLIGRSVWDADMLTFALRYPGHTVLAHRETPFGLLTVTRLGEQTMVYANNVPLLISGNTSATEEIVHFALVQRPHSPKVLIAGGNPAELVPEVLKYTGSSVRCVEENPWLRRAEREFLPFPENGRATYVEGDLRSILLSPSGHYDVIIIVAPEPSTLQSNRTYTREFVHRARLALTPAGVLCMLLPSSAEYAGDDARRVRAILRNTLADQFEHVQILPAGHDVFLASDSTLRTDIAGGIAEAGVPTTYVNPYYVQDDLLSERSRQLEASLGKDTPRNSDARPALMLAQLRYWLRHFAMEYWIPVLTGLIIVFVLFVRTDRMGIGVMTAGCGGIVLELMVLMIVQVSFGNVYKMSGGLIALYMAGMGAGAFAAGRAALAPRWYAGMQCCLALMLLLAAWLQPGISSGSTPGMAGLVPCLFLGSFGAGAVFTLTSRMAALDLVASGSRLYGYDLLGSAVGALLVGPLLLPLLGVQSVANAAAGLVVVGTVISLSSPVWRVHEKA